MRGGKLYRQGQAFTVPGVGDYPCRSSLAPTGMVLAWKSTCRHAPALGTRTAIGATFGDTEQGPFQRAWRQAMHYPPTANWPASCVSCLYSLLKDFHAS